VPQSDADIEIIDSKMVADVYNCVIHPAPAIFTLRVTRCRDGQIKVAAVSNGRAGKNRGTKPRRHEKKCNNPLYAAARAHPKPVSNPISKQLLFGRSYLLEQEL